MTISSPFLCIPHRIGLRAFGRAAIAGGFGALVLAGAVLPLIGIDLSLGRETVAAAVGAAASGAAALRW